MAEAWGCQHKILPSLREWQKIRNDISSLIINGNLTEDKTVVAEEIVSCYESLYRKDTPMKAWFENWHGKSLSLEKASSIERPFSLEEIKVAVFSLPMDKAPCPDGFTMGIYQECWETIKEDLLTVSQNFIQMGK